MQRQIDNFPDYFITNEGKVYSQRTNKVLSPIRDHYGFITYLYVVLYNGKEHKKISIHRLVAETFISQKPYKEAVVRHLDGNSLNNNVENLAWGSRLEDKEDQQRNGNIPVGIYHRNSKLTVEQLLEIRENFSHPWKEKSLRFFAEKFNVSISAIQRAAKFITYKKDETVSTFDTL